MKIPPGSPWRRRVFCMTVVVVGATVLAIPAAKASGKSPTNLRSDERNARSKISLGVEGVDQSVSNEPSSVEIYRVESPSTAGYYASEGWARDAVLAYALRDEIAMIETEIVSPASLFVGENGRVMPVGVL